MWLCVLLMLQAPPPQSFDESLKPLISAHCVECHSGPRPKGDLDMGAWIDGSVNVSPVDLRESLERVRERLILGEMPPPSRPEPTLAELDRALTWLDACLPREAGHRPTLRRLNRSEYERSVRDLFGIGYPARELFPADDVGAMFDNDAAVASVSELGVERWVEAAERVAARALPPQVETATRLFSAGKLEPEGGAKRNKTEISIYSPGAALAHLDLARDSRYRIEVIAYADLAGDELPRVSFEVDAHSIAMREVHVEHGETETLEFTTTIAAGEHDVAARFVNDFYAPDNPDPKRRDRNVHIRSLSVIGPLDPAPATAFTQWIEDELAHGTFESTLRGLGLRVWRRPLEARELARLSGLSKTGDLERERLRVALVALLASPNFLYRIEASAVGEPLSDFELATRLSFFLWASAPDALLLEHASRGDLRQPAVLASELRRMLRDARSRSLVEEFAAQWFGWRALERATPDPHTFPIADSALLSSMRQECEAFFEAMLREERPLDEFIDADFTFADERLAKLYGFEGIAGEGMRRVHLNDRERGGLLGQAAILTATSNPTRTSPVKRGKWILETLLGEHVPPPPPGVGALSEQKSGVGPKTMREQLDLHRTKEDCASCHNHLDPLGFALEGFDAIGQRRTHDGETAVDCKGKLADGTEVDGVIALKRYLLSRGTFAQSLARALFSYALGRAPSRSEQRDLNLGVDALAPKERTLASVIGLICRQPAFQSAGGP